MYKLIVIIAAVLLTSCTNSIQQRYTSRLNQTSPIHLEFLKQNEEPKFYTSQNVMLDNLILQSRHYRQIGILGFHGKSEEIASVRTLAKEVGATVVLLNPTHFDLKYLSLPSVYHSGTTNYYSNFLNNWHYEFIPNEKISAIFFANSIQNIHVGIGLNPLPLSSERKRGALITIISEDTPAFSSNLRPGDILIKVNDQQVTSYNHGVVLLNKIDPQDKHLVLTVIRDGKEEVETLNFYKL